VKTLTLRVNGKHFENGAFQKRLGHDNHVGRFLFTKNFGKFPLEISVWEKRVPFATSSIRGSRGTPGRLNDRERYGTGDKNNKDENSGNGTQIFHWEVSTGKTGLPFQQFRLFQKILEGRTKKSCSIYIPTGISGIFW